MEELTHALAFSPFAIGLYQAYKGAKEQDLFREFKNTYKSYYTSTVSSRASLEAVGPYMTAVQKSNDLLRAKNTKNALTYWNAFSKAEEIKDLEAGKRGIAQVLTNPNLKDQLARHNINYNDVMNRIGSLTDGKDLWNYVKTNLLPLSSSVPSLEDELIKGIGGRAFLNEQMGRNRHSGKMAQMMFEPGTDFSVAQNVLKEQDVKGLKGYKAAQRLFQVAKGGVAGTVGGLEYFRMPTGGGNWSTYARLNTRTMGQINIPLDHNKFQFAPGIESSIYHLGGRGNTIAAPPGMMLRIGSENNRFKILPGEGGTPFMRWEEKLFWQKGSILEDLLSKGGVPDLEKALASVDPEAVGTAGVMKYFQTISPNLSGATVALGRASTAVLATEGYDDLQALMRELGLSQTDLIGQIEEQLNKEGYSVRAGGSPGQIPGVPNKAGSIDVFGRNIERGIWDVYSHPELTSDIRRPKQGWSAPWIMQNQRELIRSRQYLLDNAEIYNPVKSPMLNTELYRKMSRGSMSAYVQPSIISSNSSFLSDIFGIEEGESLVAMDQSHPRYFGSSKIHRIARSTKDVSSIDYNPKLEKFFPLAEIADTRERRFAIHKLQRQKKFQFEVGELLGQKLDHSRGLTEEFLKLGGQGDVVLRDIVTDEKGYRLEFARIQPFQDTIKGYMGEKSTAKGTTSALLSSRLGEDSFFSKVTSGKELTKQYNDLLLRNQQVTGLKYSLFEPRSPYAAAAKNTGFLRFLSSDNVLSNVEKLGTGVFDRLGLGAASMATETATSTKMLLGTVAAAYGAYKRFGLQAEDLGKIFHLEGKVLQEALEGNNNPYNLVSLLSNEKFTTALGGAKAEAFKSDLLRGIRESRYAKGDIPTLYRDIGSAYLESTPRLERRAFDFLMSSHGFPDLPEGNLGKMLLSNVSANLILDEPEKFQALKEFAKQSRGPGENVKAIGFGDRPLAEVGKEMLAGTGGYIDPSSKLGKNYGPLYMPDKIQMRLISGMIDVGGGVEPMAQSYQKTVEQFLSSLTKVEGDDPAAISLARKHWENVKRQELGLQQRGIEKFWRGSVGNAIYETVQRLDTRHLVGTDSLKYTMMGEGLGVASNRATIEELAEKAINRAGTQAEIDEIIRQRDLVLDPTVPKGRGSRYMAPMHVSRNPNLFEHSHQMMGLYYDPDLDDLDGRVFRFGKRVKNGIDFSPGLTMASSFDADGDRTINAWISGAQGRAAFEAINNKNSRDIINRWNDNAIARRTAITNRLKDTINAKGVLKESSRFVEAAASQFGQAQIGMLSYRINELQIAADMAESLGGMNPENRSLFTALFEALEQEAIGFKHVIGGKTITEGLTEDIERILSAETIEDSKLSLKNMLNKYFGQDARGKAFLETGIDYGEGSFRISESAIDSLMPGIEALKSKEMQAVTALIRSKSEDTMNRSIQKTMEMLSPEADLNNVPVGRIIAEHFREALDTDEGLGTMRKMVGDHIRALNVRALNEAQKGTRSAIFAKAAKPIGLGLLGTGILYSMFDKGYADEPLEVPGQVSTSMGMRASIADGSILRDQYMGRSRQAQQGGPMMPAPPGGQNVPYVPNSIPNRSAYVSNTGRMSVDSTIPDHVDPQALADRLRYSVPHAQIGVNVSHKYDIPTDIEHEL